MAEMLVVQSKVKDVVKEEDMNMSGDFAEALSTKVEKLIKDAIERAKANGRKTLRGYDL
ncbi:MAG: DUF1931 domain-containing protein [Candidatus Aenigmarchaeota archaeon ex4484_56]|nr:MAG: DUF1931 domain-containing protein [Candidatus Aenigmarchaeota archaeon ex4484_56]